jgi:hypothetical protein
VTQQEVEAAVRELVESTNNAAPGNQWEFAEVPEWLADYLTSHEEEVRRFPSEVDKSHWDLTSTDHEVGKRANFLVVVFHGAEVLLVGGRGDAAKIRAFGESEFPDDIADMMLELTRRFESIQGPLVIARSDFNRWLLG